MALTHPSTRPGPRGLGAAAAAETLLVLPATALLAASAVRMMQPPGREPAQTTGRIAQWAIPHTPLYAAFLFLAMPLAALVLGATALARRGSKDEQLRRDALEFVAAARRQMVNGILLAGALVSAAILAAAVVHIITD
jgi:hypothetical protein